MIEPALFDNSILKAIGKIADDNNFQVCAVGGYVRDRLLGKRGKDIDFVVMGDGPTFAKKVAKSLATKEITVYEKFGTAMVRHNDHQLEFVGARKESYRGDSRKPMVVATDLLTDLSRRDFTINAMAVSLNASNYGELFDPFAGKDDLSSGVIKTPLEPAKTFFDDPLRIMRAIRFACQLHFTIDPRTKEGIAAERERLGIISQERITDELMKILAAQKPSVGFRLMEETGVLEIVTPEIAAMRGVEQIGHYSHKDVYSHTLQVVDNLARVTNKLALRFAALYHDVAKPATKDFKPGIGWTFHGHDELGARMISGYGKKLKLSNETISYAQKLVRLHLRPIQLAEEGVTDSAIRRLLFVAGDEIDDLLLLCRADITSGNPRRVASHLANFDYLAQRMREVEEKDRIRQFQPPVRGDEIMQALALEPGPLVGKIKKSIEEAILNGEIPNEHDAAFEYLLKIKDKILSSQN